MDQATAAAEVAARLSEVRREIAAAARAAKRQAAEVKLVAVTKTVPIPVIEEAIASGQLSFGENRVQEAQAKWPELKSGIPRSSCISSGRCNRTRCATLSSCST